jgi:hypothetical protein
MKKTKQAPADPRRSHQDVIDDRVIAQADDDSAWEPPIHVSRSPKAIRRELLSKPRT